MISSALKLKFYNVVKLLLLDPTFALIEKSSQAVRYSLNETHEECKVKLDRKITAEGLFKYAQKLALPAFNSKIEMWPSQKKNVVRKLKKFRLNKQLVTYDCSFPYSKKIDETMHSELHEVVEKESIKKIIDSEHSSSSAKTQKIIEEQFSGNSRNSMAVERAMSELDSLFLA